MIPFSAVLFDRDGTLVEDVPYNGDPDRVRLLPGAEAAVDCSPPTTYTGSMSAPTPCWAAWTPGCSARTPRTPAAPAASPAPV